MQDKQTAMRNAKLMLIAGIVFLILGIYFLVSDAEGGAPNWYYWIGLILLGDLFIIFGIRGLKKTKR
ncbi:hypothetical protein [Altibacter sp. HG106]|uniref:hypothetical protein n=1 Tax=Altibacter sp. HG106 TaxID=3023937 RepID=UPI002350459B|nr:hypothetical protein [Altibacter sp. HG106]MDC7993625.1 hypothetical protein [Altibacter sp. HG106]